MAEYLSSVCMLYAAGLFCILVSNENSLSTLFESHIQIPGSQTGGCYAMIIIRHMPLKDLWERKRLSSNNRYEFFYDIIRGGQYTFRIQELHEKCGPIVRINPYELHISDSSYYETLYAASASGEKRAK